MSTDIQEMQKLVLRVLQGHGTENAWMATTRRALVLQKTDKSFIKRHRPWLQGQLAKFLKVTLILHKKLHPATLCLALDKVQYMRHSLHAVMRQKSTSPWATCHLDHSS